MNNDNKPIPRTSHVEDKREDLGTLAGLTGSPIPSQPSSRQPDDIDDMPHPLHVEDKREEVCAADHISITELLAEFKRRGIDITNWDGDEGAEKAIVDGVCTYIADYVSTEGEPSTPPLQEGERGDKEALEEIAELLDKPEYSPDTDQYKAWSIANTALSARGKDAVELTKKEYDDLKRDAEQWRTQLKEIYKNK